MSTTGTIIGSPKASSLSVGRVRGATAGVLSRPASCQGGRPLRETAETSLRSELTAAEAGLLFRPLRQDASESVEAPVDFGGLVLGFSFFVIVAAMALAGMLFAFAMEQRNRQAGLLLAVGLPRRKVRRLFLAEGTALAALGAALGAWPATLYGETILFLLTGEWRVPCPVPPSTTPPALPPSSRVPPGRNYPSSRRGPLAVNSRPSPANPRHGRNPRLHRPER